MRLPLVSGRFVRLVALVAFLPALLVSPMKGDAQAPEAGDLMEKMDADFVALVQAALIASVQELVSETPYGTHRKTRKVHRRHGENPAERGGIPGG